VIARDSLRDALSRHIVRVLEKMPAHRESMAVDGFDQGVDLKAAADVGRDYYRQFLAPMSASHAAAAAFAAGVVVGRTATESELTVEEVAG
jgi:hypothetical protein